MSTCTIKVEDLRELERLNRALVVAGAKAEARWEATVALLNFLDDHPTLLSFLINAGRMKLAEREASHEAEQIAKQMMSE